MRIDGAGLARLSIAPLYAFAGFVHVRRPGFFAPMMPAFVPAPHAMIVATGVCEIAGAAALFVPRLRAAAGLALALYAVCVYPVNIEHAVHDLGGHTGLGWWYHAPRLFAQPFICWWALAAGGLMRRRAPHGASRSTGIRR